MFVQDVIKTLENYWANNGCVILLPWLTEVGAGTLHPATVFNVISDRPCKIAFVQPSSRPIDGRYGVSPNRLYQHHQYQVLLKPAPANIRDLYLMSLEEIGLNLKDHDIRFYSDNWQNPSIGAAGIGWEIVYDGMEISQFTYMQRMGGINTKQISGEITYGIERICMFLQDCQNVNDLQWNKNFTYADIFQQQEFEFSAFTFEKLDSEKLFHQFDHHLKLAVSLLEDKIINQSEPINIESINKNYNHRTNKPLPIIAYNECIKASHVFNLLEANNSISQIERADFILKIREIVKRCCETWLLLYSTKPLSHNNDYV